MDIWIKLYLLVLENVPEVLNAFNSINLDNAHQQF